MFRKIDICLLAGFYAVDFGGCLLFRNKEVYVVSVLESSLKLVGEYEFALGKLDFSTGLFDFFFESVDDLFELFFFVIRFWKKKNIFE